MKVTFSPIEPSGGSIPPPTAGRNSGAISILADLFLKTQRRTGLNEEAIYATARRFSRK